MKDNIHFKISLLLLLIVLIYFISRFIFYLFNFSYFNENSFIEILPLFFYGLRFDFSAIFSINCLVILLLLLPLKITSNKIYLYSVSFVFVFLNSIALLFNTIDFVYFSFINTRTTAEIFNYLTISKDIIIVMPSFLKDFWYVPVLLLILMWLLWQLFIRIFRSSTPSNYPLKNILKRVISIIIWLFVSVVFIRGGFQLRPITIASASHYADVKYLPLVLNTPFSIIKTIGRQSITYNVYFNSEQEINTFYNAYKESDNKRSFKSYNVVIFILEGFSKEHIGSLNKDLEDGTYKGYTPFLDSLMTYSLVFGNAYANGKRTIDAPPAILSSIPNLMSTAFVLSPYTCNKINSIANLLKTKGYISYFFHGGTNGTMGLDNYAKLAGFDHYYGRDEYNNDEDFDGKWGIFDEPFLQRMALELDKSPKPFLSTVFTVSSHHPYTVPERYKNTFPKGKMDIHESIAYADYALKRFFETVSATSWFDNTLFVFTADHTSEAYHDSYKTKVGVYAIPIFFYLPHSELIKNHSKIAQQTDIMPTILGILNFDTDYIAFGASLLDSTQEGFSVNYSDGVYQIIINNYLMIFDGKESIALYDTKEDTLLRNNIINTTDSRTLMTIENTLKAYIQSYQYRMINNKLSIQ